MYSCFAIALLALTFILSIAEAVPTSLAPTQDTSTGAQSLVGVARLIGRNPPNFSCSPKGVFCRTAVIEHYGEALSVVTHILGRQVSPVICSVPGTHCAWSNADGTVSVSGTSIHRRKVAPWSSCGFPGITCTIAGDNVLSANDASQDVATRDVSVEASATSDESTEDTITFIEERKIPWSSCGFPGITCAVQYMESVAVSDIPWAPSTLATYGLPAPTAA